MKKKNAIFLEVFVYIRLTQNVFERIPLEHVCLFDTPVGRPNIGTSASQQKYTFRAALLINFIKVMNKELGLKRFKALG